jgi:hypothetical protein
MGHPAPVSASTRWGKNPLFEQIASGRLKSKFEVAALYPWGSSPLIMAFDDFKHIPKHIQNLDFRLRQSIGI